MLLVRPQPAPVSKVEISPFGVSFASDSTGGPSLCRGHCRFPSQKEPWVHPLGFTLIRRLLDGKAQEGALA
jgi:hypothetical protein